MGRRGSGSWGSVAFLFVVLTGASTALAAAPFHAGGTGACDGCHGKVGDGSAPLPGAVEGETGKASGAMLRGSDPSSTCLRCHEAGAAATPEQHHVSTAGTLLAPGVPPRQLTPGGDFAWLKKEYRWRGAGKGGGGAEERSGGEQHGHNIVAADFGYQADRLLAVAPGGTYPAAALSCTSCHDPHGSYRRSGDGAIVREGMTPAVSGSYGASPDPATFRPVGVYRMLGGRGYQPQHAAGLPGFESDPPAAVAPVTYNRSEARGDTRVAYGSGMSEWCRNCHPGIHGDGRTLGHPAGNSARLSPAVIASYDSYVASGNLNGSAAAAATSLVPFEMGTVDYGVLGKTAETSSTHGPDTAAGTPNVMCLTCHRAHASAWDGMTRWNTKATFIVQNGRYPGMDNPESAESAQGRSSAETARGYYDRPASAFAVFQRSLCNKCHPQD